MTGKGRLFLIPTGLSAESDYVFGEDIRSALPGISYFLVENVRSARRFISSLRLGITIESLNFQVLDKRTAQQDISKMMDPIRKGMDIGVMSEAGCPGIADPGSLAVEYAHKLDVEVVPFVGPSSILLALMGSGLNGQRFQFHGYLPIDEHKRVQAIKSLEKESRQKEMTQIFIETPYRNEALLKSILKAAVPDTRLTVASDLTGKHQQIKTKRIKDWMREVPGIHKIPTVFLLQA